MNNPDTAFAIVGPTGAVLPEFGSFVSASNAYDVLRKSIEKNPRRYVACRVSPVSSSPASAD